MNPQDNFNFKRISAAIEFINSNYKQQPSLNEIAKSVNLSPHHFQRLFTDWAGISPKKFIQYLSINYTKQLLKEKATLSEASYEAGLSGTGRLHDLFINLEGMTPGEYKNGGDKLTINYSYAPSPFGLILIASTNKGICHMGFVEDDRQTAFDSLSHLFPNAKYIQIADSFQQDALSIFSYDWKKINQIKLHLKGTTFQLKVWESLLYIPVGKLATYGSIAAAIGKPGASRATGTAVGTNPVAYLIPCHRVIQSSGIIGGYRWGNARKTAIIGWEAAKVKLK